MTDIMPKESIVDFTGCGRERAILLSAAIIIEGATFNEPIVRCRDCVYYDADEGGCWLIGHEIPEDEWYQRVVLYPMKPDDFCSNGKRKEADDGR